VSALIVTLGYAILYHLLRRLGANEILSAALVLWAAALTLPNLGVRPRELTHLFFAVFLNRLLLHREGRARHLWTLPIVMLLWVNTHGAFLLGLLLLALVVLGEIANWLRFGGRPPRHLCLVGVATVAAATVNPQGPWMLAYPIGYYLQEENPSFTIVTEFQSPNFHEPMSLLFAAALLLFMVLGVRRGRKAFGDGLLATVFTLQALVSTRQISVAALVLAPLLASALCERFEWARELPPSRLPRAFVKLNWLILASLLIAGGMYVRRPQVREALQLGQEPRIGLMPAAGAGFIEDNDLPGPVFNQQAWGGYLIHRWYPARRVFIDGRIDMYGPEIVSEYVRVANIQPGWSEVLDKYEVRTVLIPRDSPLSILLGTDHRWQRVFQGEVEDVFVRSNDGDHWSPPAQGRPPRRIESVQSR